MSVFGDMQTLAVFAAASTVLILMPGDNLFLMAQTILHGRRPGLTLALGLALGNTAHTTAAVLGAAVILQTSAVAFTVFKVLGVGYLLWLAWRTVRDDGGGGADGDGDGDGIDGSGGVGGDGGGVDGAGGAGGAGDGGGVDGGGDADGAGGVAAADGADAAAGRTRNLFLRGLLMNILNPKVSLFFLAFLPQFVPAGAVAPGVYMASLGAVFVALTAVIFSGIVFLSARIGVLLRRSPAVKRWLAWLTASVFVALGVRLALAERV